MQRPIIAGNWKMNKTVKEAKESAIQMKLGLDKIKGISKVICPPFIAIEPMRHLLRGSSIGVLPREEFRQRCHPVPRY